MPSYWFPLLNFPHINKSVQHVYKCGIITVASRLCKAFFKILLLLLLKKQAFLPDKCCLGVDGWACCLQCGCKKVYGEGTCLATPIKRRRHQWKGRQAFNGMIQNPLLITNLMTTVSDMKKKWHNCLFFFLRCDLKLRQMPGGSVHRQGFCDACQILWPRNLPCSWTRLWFLSRSPTFCLQCVNILQLLS